MPFQETVTRPGKVMVAPKGPVCCILPTMEISIVVDVILLMSCYAWGIKKEVRKYEGESELMGYLGHAC